MLIGYNLEGKTGFVKDLKIEGALAMIVKDAIKPNLVQTLENNPAIVHGGPFANIAPWLQFDLSDKAGIKAG